MAKIRLSAPKTMDSGGAVVSLTYDGAPLRVELPAMNVPYGLSDGFVKDGVRKGPVKYSVGFSFKGADDNPKIRAALDFFTALDDYVLNANVTNGMSWYKKPVTVEVARDKYDNPMVKYSRDKVTGALKPYPPTFNAAIRQHKGASGRTLDQFQVEMYNPDERDEQGKPMRFPSSMDLGDLLCKGCSVKPIIEFTGIWLVSGKCYATWRLVQARIDSRGDSLSGPCFTEDAPDVSAHVSGGGNKAKSGSGSKAVRPSPSSSAEGEGEGEDNDNESDGEEMIAPTTRVSVPVSAPALPPPAATPAPAAAPAPVFEDDDVVAPPAELPKKIVKKKVVAKPAA